MSDVNGEGKSDLPAELVASIRKEAITQVAKWAVAGVVGLALFAALGWWFYFERKIDEYIVTKAGGAPAGAVLSFDLSDGCPRGWAEFPDASGRFIIGSGRGDQLTPRPFRERQGQERYALGPENLPPHRHEVYRHAGQIVGDTGIPGAGADDPNKPSQVLAGQSGVGPGKSEPYSVMPPYIALLFCKKKA